MAPKQSRPQPRRLLHLGQIEDQRVSRAQNNEHRAIESSVDRGVGEISTVNNCQLHYAFRGRLRRVIECEGMHIENFYQ